MAEILDPAQVEAVAGGFRLSAAVMAMAALRIPDHLETGAATASDLAAATGSDPASLRRLLRFLAASGVLGELEPDRFAQTPFSRRLTATAPDSCRDMVLGWIALPAMYQAFGDLTTAVRAGVSGTRLRHGEGFHELLVRDPVQAALYQAANASTVGGFEAALDSYDFSGFHTVVDVGGGLGGFLAQLVRRQPQTRGILFDLPGVVAGAPAELERLGVADRIQVVAGDLFEAVPAGADAYTMFTVLRCFDDALAETALRRCREAMTAESRLVIVDMLVPEGVAVMPTARTDLVAMLVYGAGDRTEGQWRALLERSGMAMRLIAPAEDPFVCIEAVIAP